MSTFKVTAEKLTIEPHPNADRLELAQVGLYRAVVGKGEFRSGEFALYVPEQAILPDELIEELGLTGKLAGKEKNRVKAVKLRGAVSQGIVCRPSICNMYRPADWVHYHESGRDFAEVLGVTKWVPEIPTHMNGKVIPAPDLIRWIDIENLKRYPNIFEEGEEVIGNEKCHGTCLCISLIVSTGELIVSSKGFNAKNLALEEDPSNLYWRAVRQFDLHEKLKELARNTHADSVALFGEVFGAGVQDLHYGKSARNDETLGYVAFDLAANYGGQRTWIDADLFLLAANNLSIPTPPVLYSGPFNLEKLAEVASGLTVLGEGAHIREGIVIRPIREGYSDVLGGRKIAKLVSDDYVLRQGGTEYE